MRKSQLELVNWFQKFFGRLFPLLREFRQLPVNLCRGTIQRSDREQQEKSTRSENQSYEIPYPSSRQLTFDVGRIGLGRHHVRDLLDVDVTEARQLDHDVIDGVPAASFVDDLVKRLQAGTGLPGES